MAIPVFSGRVGGLAGTGAATIPVESIDPTLFGRGARDAESVPTPVTAIANAITKGIDSYQRAAQNEQALQQGQQQLQQGQLQLEEQRYRQQLLPQEMQVARTRLETQALSDQLKLEEDQFALSAKKEELSRRRNVNQIFSSIQGGDVAGGIQALEQNLPDVIKAGVTFSDKGPSFDPAIVSQISDLPYRAQKTGDPALVQRAQDIVGRFQDTINQATNVENKKPINLGGFSQQPSASLPQSFSEQQIGQAFGAPQPQQSPPPNPNAQAPFGASNQQRAQETPQQNAAPLATYSQPQKRPPAASHVIFPGRQDSAGQYRSGLPGLPPSLDPEYQITEENRPVTERVLTGPGGTAPIFDRKVKAIEEQIIADANARGEEIKPEKVRELALKQAEQTQFTAKQLESLDDTRSSAQKAEATTLRTRSALSRLEKLIQSGKNVRIGPQSTMDQVLDQLRAEAFSDSDKREIEDIRKELDTLGTAGAVQEILGAGGGSQLINTKDEREIYAGLGTGRGRTLESNIQALDLLQARTQASKEYIEIMDSAQLLGLGYTEAKTLADQYFRYNPAVTTGTINGKPFARRNENRQAPAEFLQQALGQKAGRKPDGRVVGSTPADPLNLAPQISQEITAGAFRAANASDVPTKQSQANEATIRRLISAESSGRATRADGQIIQGPEVSGQGTAKGPAQLMDATAREVWKAMGFPGQYDPNDKSPVAIERNVAMGTYYLNRMLKLFNGDTRIALAAYNAGPGKISKYAEKAEKAYGDITWEGVKQFLPPELADDVVPYVDKIAGTKETLLAEKKTPTQEELPAVISSIPNARGQDFARANLTSEGLAALKEAALPKTVDEAQGTFLGDVLNMLVSPAVAEEPTPGEGGDKTDEGAPSGPSVGEQVGSAVKTAAQAINPLEVFRDPGAQALALGAARTLAFGFEDEAGALLRMGILGEDYETAVQNTRAIRDQVQAKNPNFYLSGEIGGAFGNAATAARGAARVGAKIIGKEVAKGAAEAATAEGAKSVLRAGLQGASTGAKQGLATGALQGAGEAEGGLGERIEGGARGALIGGGVGGAVGGTIAAGGQAAANSSLARNISGRLASTFGEGKTPPALTKEEQVLQDRLKLSPTEAYKKQKRLERATNPEASLADELGPVGKPKQLLDSVAKDPRGGDELVETAERRLKGQDQRVKKIFEPYTSKKSSQASFESAAKSVADVEKRLVKERTAEANKLYGEARDSMPKGSRYSGNKSRGQFPIFKDPDVDVARGNIYVKKTLAEARERVDPGHEMPNNAYSILHEQKRILREKLDSGAVAGEERKNVAEAYNQLKNALHKNEKYRLADEAFEIASEKREQYLGKGITTLMKFAESGEFKDINKFGDRLFEMDTKHIKEMLGFMNAEEKQSIADATYAYVRNQLGKKGERLPGQSREFVDFTKNEMPEKLKTVFGPEAGKKILKELKIERKIASSASNILKTGSQTAPRQSEEKEAIKNVGSAVAEAANVAVFKGAGAPGAIRRLWGNFTRGSDDDFAKYAKEIGELTYTDRQRAIQFLEKVRGKLTETKNNEGLRLWDEFNEKLTKAVPTLSKQSARTAAQVTTTKDESTKPQTRLRKMRGDVPEIVIRPD